MIDYSNRLLFSPGEFAAVTPFPEETVRIMCREGRLPGAYKIGKRWMIPRSALDRLGSINAPPPKPTLSTATMSPMEREAFFCTRDELLRTKRKVS